MKFKFGKRLEMEKTLNMKVVDLGKLENFVVHKFLNWIHLVIKNDLHSVWYNMNRMKIGYECTWVCGVVVK
jgi:hypothetical protein